MRVTGGWNSCQLVIWTMMSRKGICKCLQGPGGHSWRCASNVVKSTLLAKSKCICPDYKLHLSRFVSSVDCGATLRKGASNAVNASSLPNVRQADKYLIWQGDKYQKWQADKYSKWQTNKFVEFKMTGGQIFKSAIGKLTNIWTAQLLFVSNTNLTDCTPSLTLIATRIQPLEVVICYQYQEGV